MFFERLKELGEALKNTEEEKEEEDTPKVEPASYNSKETSDAFDDLFNN